jgi:hypothetical protein
MSEQLSFAAELFGDPDKCGIVSEDETGTLFACGWKSNGTGYVHRCPRCGKLIEGREKSIKERHWEWLTGRYRKYGEPAGVTDAARPVFERLLEEFGQNEAFERSKCLDVLDGVCRCDGWSLGDADVLGLFDHTLHYHVCWDRAFAVRHGAPHEVVSRIHKCVDFNLRNHRYADESGVVIWEEAFAKKSDDEKEQKK